MPRERQFSEDDVLQAAADAFAEHGFQGTSMAMLLDATGLAKQSLYNSFGDKRALYLQALDCASQRWAPLQRRMAAARDGAAALQLFFDELLSQCSSGDAAARNCIVSSGLLEAVDDSDIRQRLRAKWAATHEMLRDAVERGQKDGSIANPAPSAQLADLLLSLMSGVRVAGQAGTPPERLRQTIRLGLLSLQRPP